MAANNDNDRITTAVAHYRREMLASNRNFLKAKIRILTENQALTNKKRLEKLAPFFQCNKWPTSGYGLDITSPEELLAEDRIEDGTTPPCSEEEREQYLAHLIPLLRDSAGENDFEPPTEFIAFLTVANAITGPSFVPVKFPWMEGTSCAITGYSLANRNPCQTEWYRDGWHVITGWQCGYGTATGATLLLYAYKYTGGTEEEQIPKWRVYTWDDMDHIWFSFIEDYVYYRSQWLQRLPDGWQNDLRARD